MDFHRDVVVEVPTHTKRDFPPIIAVHGMWATASRWERFAKFFSEQGFHFVAPTLPHHFKGANPNLLRSVSLLDYVDDVRRCVQGRSALVSMPPILIGHSMGGLIAQKIAERTKLTALVLICSAPPRGVSLYTDKEYKRAIFRYFFKILFGRPFKPSYELACRFIMNNIPEEEWQKLYHGFVYESGRAAREILFGRVAVDERKIRCPVFVVGGM